MTQMWRGEQTITGIPAPYTYTTRPSFPGAGIFWPFCHWRLTPTASCAVAVNGTSRLTTKSRGTSFDRGPTEVVGASTKGGTVVCGSWADASSPCNFFSASVNRYFSGEGTAESLVDGGAA